MKATIVFRSNRVETVERKFLSIQSSDHAVALRDGAGDGVAIFPLDAIVSIVLTEEEASAAKAA